MWRLVRCGQASSRIAERYPGTWSLYPDHFSPHLKPVPPKLRNLGHRRVTANEVILISVCPPALWGDS